MVEQIWSSLRKIAACCTDRFNVIKFGPSFSSARQCPFTPVDNADSATTWKTAHRCAKVKYETINRRAASQNSLEYQHEA